MIVEDERQNGCGIARELVAELANSARVDQGCFLCTLGFKV